MNNKDKEMITRLEALPFIEARKTIKNGILYTIGSPNYTLALSWLEGKEAELRDERENETLSAAKDASRIASETISFTRRAVSIDRIIAIAAIIIAVIAAHKEIRWLITSFVNMIKTS